MSIKMQDCGLLKADILGSTKMSADACGCKLTFQACRCIALMQESCNIDIPKLVCHHHMLAVSGEASSADLFGGNSAQNICNCEARKLARNMHIRSIICFQ